MKMKNFFKKYNQKSWLVQDATTQLKEYEENKDQDKKDVYLGYDY